MIRNIGSRINDIRVKQKIIILFIVGVVIPTLVLLSIFMSQIQTEFSQREEAVVQGELTRLKSNINTTVETVKQLGSIYFADKDLSWALETYSDGSKDSLTVLRDIDSQVSSNLAVHPFISDINIYFDNSNIFNTIQAHFLSEDIKNLPWYRQYVKKDSNVYLNYDTEGEVPYIYFIRKLNLLKFESPNIIKIDISTQWIDESFQSENISAEDKQMYLISPEDQIVASNVRDADNSAKTFESIEKKRGIIVYKQSFDNNSLFKGWKVAIVYEKSVLQKDLTYKMMILFGVVILAFALSLFMFYELAHTIITRLEQLASVMDQSDDLTLRTLDTDMGRDEIGITANSYNRMVNRITELINANTLTNQELKESNVALLDSIEKVEMQDKQINELVYKDKLTGLFNRFGITTFIDRHIKEIIQDDSFAIGFMDLDNFKLINDTYGHDTGDEILKQFAARLKVFEGEDFQIGRFGGDEFILIIKYQHDLEKLNQKLKNLARNLKEPLVINKITFVLTISMGVSIYGTHSRSRHELITLADIALYKAKELGRDRIVFFESDMYQRLLKNTHQQELIRKAIREDQFILFYQPYYYAESKEMAGCEALLRWKSECHLEMTPHEVIIHIEEMGLMVEFGNWIIKEACIFSKKLNHQRKNQLPVSINISALQLMAHNFTDDVLKIIHDYDVDPRSISLEMTESILMRSVLNGSKVTYRLREKGIQIFLDDFGTGYSSLGYFKELPISTLKIDKSFVDNICTNDYDVQLIETIIQLAHNKDVRVIAEGIETEEQYSLLKEMSCDIIQGYLLCKPISEAAIMEMLLVQEV